MDTKIRIDLAQRTVEAEGSESFVREVYRDFKERVSSQPIKARDVKSAEAPKRKAESKTSGKKKVRTGGIEHHTNVSDLNLKGSGKGSSLRDFYSAYSPTSFFERNVLFVYFLERHVVGTAITPNHVYSCYREVGDKVPKALEQSLKDTSRRKSWIDTSSLDEIKMTIQGDNYIEHDMKGSESTE